MGWRARGRLTQQRRYGAPHVGGKHNGAQRPLQAAQVGVLAAQNVVKLSDLGMSLKEVRLGPSQQLRHQSGPARGGWRVVVRSATERRTIGGRIVSMRAVDRPAIYIAGAKAFLDA